MTVLPTAAERPRGSPRVSFRWINLLFMHWPVPVDRLQPLIPDQLTVEPFDGTAWIGLVPFTMTHIRRRPLPVMPGLRTIHETNVRTYVTHKGVSGVYFFSLDASHATACAWARRFWHLNYVHARIHVAHEKRRFHYGLRRTGDTSMAMDCQWLRGEAREQSRPGSLDYFLTERYSMFTLDRAGHVLRGRIWHEPWPLHHAELIALDDGLVRASGIDLNASRPPLLHHCDQLHAAAWPLEHITGGD